MRRSRRRSRLAGSPAEPTFPRLLLFSELLTLGATRRGWVDVQAGEIDRLAAIGAFAQITGCGARQRGVDVREFRGQSREIREIAFARGLGSGVVVGLVGAPRQAGFGVIAEAVLVQPSVQRGSKLAAALMQARRKERENLLTR